MNPTPSYPVLVLCGRDHNKREFLKVHDPDGKYPSKVLIPILGKRVIDWVLEAFLASRYVNKVYLIGLQENDYPFNDQIRNIPFETISTIQEKILAGSDVLSRIYPDLEYLVISTGDAPGISTEAVDLFFTALKDNQDADIFLSGVPEDITSEEIPDHKRLVARFSDQKVYIGEMGAIRIKKIPQLKNEINQFTVWARQFDGLQGNTSVSSFFSHLARRPTLLALIIKYLILRPRFCVFLYRYFSGKLSRAEGERIVSRILGLRLKSAIIPDVGFGMDMDLPEDYQKLSNFIQRRKIHSE